jgi:hypothetical protein
MSDTSEEMTHRGHQLEEVSDAIDEGIGFIFLSLIRPV